MALRLCSRTYLVRGSNSGTATAASGTRTFYSYVNEPAHPIPGKKPKTMSAEEAMSVVKSGNTVFIQGAAATPRGLVPALAEHGRKSNLKGVKIHHIHTEGAAEYNAPELQEVFRSNSLFTGANCRQAINEGRADFTPIFLGEIPLLFKRGIIKPDVCLVQVTPADKHGYHSLGTSVDCTRAALEAAKHIIGQVNPRLPRTQGDALVHESHFDSLVEATMEIPEHASKALSDVEKLIGKHIAENLVEDGATMQMGIGAIPDAVLAQLGNHKDLGVHSEMFSDGVVDLVQKGVITNNKKVIEQGKIVSSFCIGTRKLFDFMDDNPFLTMKTIDFVNKEFIVAQNPKVTAINSCIEVDIVGNVCSDSIGTRVYSGFGGQVDFIRGAALGMDGKGKPILAMPSTTNKGISKIAPTLKLGAGVVTTRAHAHYIVTEYGIAYLFGKNYRQRARALIDIAHPDHRETLEKAAFERLKCMPSLD
ncbi:4-hydroxybutyrate coenzyme A transferase [Halotydeus destructor]|nr:4-hydroxybutyrate coenzyme A transferase [Halotydeus destructor]